MAGWTGDELSKIAAAEEFRAAGATFVDADHGLDDQLDAAYWAKYRRYSGIVPSIVTPQARSTTIKLLPHSNDS